MTFLSLFIQQPTGLPKPEPTPEAQEFGEYTIVYFIKENIWYIGIILVILLMFYFYNQNRKKQLKKKKEEEMRQKRELEQKKQEGKQ